MKIALIDVDGHHFPSLPLMKLSAYHKNQGDAVEWWNGFAAYDLIYMSKVFTTEYTAEADEPVNGEVIKGGTGYSLSSILPDAVEHQYPDYGLYPQYAEAYGFLTRGCPRSCGFCLVSAKEGWQSRQVADLSEFWRSQQVIKLLDPNLLAAKEHEVLLQQLIKSKAQVDFTQGLDARLLNSDNTALIQQVRTKMLHFAWDSQKDSDAVLDALIRFKGTTKIDERKARVYVLTNYDTSFEFDLYRVNTLRQIGYDPYVMIYSKPTAPKNIRQLARWVNNKYIWRSCQRFEDYGKHNLASLMEV